MASNTRDLFRLLNYQDGNRRWRREMAFRQRRHRFDGTVGTKPPMVVRVLKSRRRAKAARRSRKANT